jgi:hypothetical protein
VEEDAEAVALRRLTAVTQLLIKTARAVAKRPRCINSTMTIATPLGQRVRRQSTTQCSEEKFNAVKEDSFLIYKEKLSMKPDCDCE